MNVCTKCHQHIKTFISAGERCRPVNERISLQPVCHRKTCSDAEMFYHISSVRNCLYWSACGSRLCLCSFLVSAEIHSVSGCYESVRPCSLSPLSSAGLIRTDSCSFYILLSDLINWSCSSCFLFLCLNVCRESSLQSEESACYFIVFV